ncbi:MAG: saccharopine dehydrogenase NADP-binding domain-containing protein [Elusimicrobia bacterium]|nr:saccharopine dehydrogenase NADP-binding domain-containing protein [Elusimicrobiota bacterium]
MGRDGTSYLILGSGFQGIAASYDVILHGEPQRVIIADQSPKNCEFALKKIKHLLAPFLKKNRIQLLSYALNASHKKQLQKVMKGNNAVLSALPYYLNPLVAQTAIEEKVHYCDLGGYFEMTERILKMDKMAKKAQVTLIPDCGVSPGMCNSLALCAMEQLTRTESVRIYCGGLPVKPKGPLGYKIVFNLEGVLGNYFGKSYVLRNGRIKKIASFSEPELIQFEKPLKLLEAFVTGGATSSCPWTFKGKVKNYEYKTLRYPGHYEKIQFLKELGLLDTDPVFLNGAKIVPRKFFVKLVEPALKLEQEKDLLVMKVIVAGWKDKKNLEITYDVLEYDDPKTGFSSMQRTTGFSAAIILELLAKNEIFETGVVPLERGVPGSLFLKEIRKRGIKVRETIRQI